ncbi:MAG: branched-chain amino acid ABC transporter permease [Acetivibrionales bacterium]|jgi:branched-chain amino acid transport system permease protein
MTMFVQQTLNGITQGGLFALLAISYSMVYGVLNLVNFSTGSLYMLGALGGWLIVVKVTNNLWLGIIGGGIATFLTAFILEKIAFKSIRGISRTSSLICTIGFSQVINELVAILFGRSTQNMPAFFLNDAFQIAGVSVRWLHIILILAVVVMLVSLQLLIYKTRVGLAIRTVSMDYKTAGLMGINVDRSISIAFSVAGACAGIAGVLGCVYYSAFSPAMGVQPGLKSFSAAVFGGLTSMPGAILGGYLMGLIENFGVQIFSAGYRDIISFVILILFLLVRPQGILGSKNITKA